MKWIVAFTFISTFTCHGLTVKEAYRLIPHQQTTYSASKSPMDNLEKQSLETIFEIVDEGIVWRYEAYRNLYHRHDALEAISSYEQTAAKMRGLKVSSRITPVKDQIADSMKQQIEYLKSWSNQIKVRKVPFNPKDQQVQRASHGLREAYQNLMELFPNESSHNKKAFFDHLCALDFI